MFSKINCHEILVLLLKLLRDMRNAKIYRCEMTLYCQNVKINSHKNKQVLCNFNASRKFSTDAITRSNTCISTY